LDKKIERNIQRDIEVNDYLLKNGWKVLRFWGKDVLKKTDICLTQIEILLNEIERKNID
jgi:very-short-patch-repair endonuclease